MLTQMPQPTLIVEDEAIQAGAATFRGTRILVYDIADLLAKGAGEAELRKDYPRLTPAMLEAASLYARAHPKHKRPRTPAWQQVTTGAERASIPAGDLDSLKTGRINQDVLDAMMK